MLARSSQSLGSLLVVFVLVAGTLATRAFAQCSTQWLPGSALPGTNGVVRASTLWDPDGAGPLRHMLIIGGKFTIAGSVQVKNIAAYDPASGVLSALGSGVSGDP